MSDSNLHDCCPKFCRLVEVDNTLFKPSFRTSEPLILTCLPRVSIVGVFFVSGNTKLAAAQIKITVPNMANGMIRLTSTK